MCGGFDYDFRMCLGGHASRYMSHYNMRDTVTQWVLHRSLHVTHQNFDIAMCS